MLETLIPELLEHIIYLLDRSDLFSLRLACRSLHERTAYVFGRTWFGTFETDLSETALRRLDSVAGHSIFRNSVTTLRVVRRSGYMDITLGGYRLWPRQTSAALDLSSTVIRDFQEAVGRFENCTTFEVCDRPGDCVQGATSGLSHNDAAHLVLSTIIGGTRPVQTLRIYLERFGGYPDGHRLLLPPTASLQSLRELVIHWDIGDEILEQAVGVVTAAVSLETLHLNMSTSEHANKFLLRLAAAPTLPPIANLRFGQMVAVSEMAFVNVILRFRASLRSLHIGHVGLADDWRSFFTNLSRQDFPHLENFTVCILRAPQPPERASGGTVYFCPLRLKQETLKTCGGKFEFNLVQNRRKMRVCGVRYAGSPAGTKLALQALADDSHYLISRIVRSPSPGLPNMKTFTGDSVGHVVPRFDQVKTWRGLGS